MVATATAALVLYASPPTWAAAARGAASSPTPTAAISPAPTPAFRFAEVTAEAGIDYTHGFAAPANGISVVDMVSGGVAAGDYDGDGWIDLYAVHGSLGPNLLLHNRGDGTFEEVAAAAGVGLAGRTGSGPLFGDFDGDGWLDLYVGYIGRVVATPTLFRNRGNGTFEDVTEASRFQFPPAFYIGASMGDFDRDGDLDFFLTQWDTFLPDGVPLNHLWRNNGDGTFTSIGAGVNVTPAFFSGLQFHWSFTANFADINNDGWPDILLASDFGNSQIFINDGDGTFTETTTPVISDENGMGAAIGDYDNDGDLDWFVSSIYDPSGLGTDGGQKTDGVGTTGNRLYRNRGDGTFEDATDEAGVRDGNWGWGSCFADFNNDGFLDIFHVDGWGIEGGRDRFYGRPSRLFIANGDGTFTERAEELGIDDRGEGRGVVCFDYDNDGDIDIFVADNGQPPHLYRNEGGNRLGFLDVKLRGVARNSEAIGARIDVTAAGTTQMRELRAGSNYVSQDPAIAHFGLGAATSVDEVRVVWPDGGATDLRDLPADQRITISETNADANCDGRVGAADLVAISGLMPAGQPERCVSADVDADNRIGAADLAQAGARIFAAAGAP